MTVLNVFGGDDGNDQDFRAADLGTAIVRVPYAFQHSINDHITRYNIGGIHDVPSAIGGLVTSILPSIA
jgi:hypothetical protein